MNITLPILVFIAALCAEQSRAALITGLIVNAPEAQGNIVLRDENNYIYNEWSVARRAPEGDGLNAGWFYPAHYPWSNADVYVYKQLPNIRQVSDASVFPYSTDRPVKAEEGDTVFLRSIGGYYGAIRVDDIVAIPGAQFAPLSVLNGRWYFQSDGTADFSVPEPSTAALLAIGFGVFIFRWKQR